MLVRVPGSGPGTYILVVFVCYAGYAFGAPRLLVSGPDDANLPPCEEDVEEAEQEEVETVMSMSD